MRCGDGCRETQGRNDARLTGKPNLRLCVVASLRPRPVDRLVRRTAPHSSPADEPGPRRQARLVHAREGIMRKILIAVIGLAAIGGCARKPETQAAVDSTSRNIQLPKPDSAVALNDRPPAPPEAPPAAAAKAATPR